MRPGAHLSVDELGGLIELIAEGLARDLLQPANGNEAGTPAPANEPSTRAAVPRSPAVQLGSEL